MNITEADRAIARRVIRRHVQAGEGTKVRVHQRALLNEFINYDFRVPVREPNRVEVSRSVFDVACIAAAQGRAYAAALRGAK